MIDVTLRYFKRFAVLIPGLIGTYFVAADVYPFLEGRVPAPVAFLAAYVFAAYILIPALLRVIRLFIRPDHIPNYCVTADGFASDPVNIGLIGTERQVTDAMTAAGWFAADRRAPATILKLIRSIILNQPYPTAPFSNLYLFGRKQDLAFQLPIGHNPNARHHVRFWMTEPTLTKSEKEHLDFWQRLVNGKAKSGKKQLWVGAASRDTGIGFIRHNAQLTHSVHPDTDAERDKIAFDLKSTNKVKSWRNVVIGEAYRLRNRVFRSHLRSDGKMTILTLK